jgi:hypothetical protein
MRSILTFVALLAMTIFITGCGSDSGRYVSNGVETPEWVSNPQYDGEVAAIGRSRKMKSGMEVDRAMHEGRVNLAKVLEVHLNGMTENYMTDGGVDEDTQFIQNFTKVSRERVKQYMRGTNRDKLWQHPQTGEVWVRVVLNSDAIDALASHIERDSGGKISKSKALADIYSQEALDRLDNLDYEADRRMNGQPTQTSTAPVTVNVQPTQAPAPAAQ